MGNNGSGKTNLLDAVYYLALSKSHGQSKDELNIQHQAPFMALHGRFAKNEKEEVISLSMKRGERKQLLHDQVPYLKRSEHIGKYPVVFIAPDDTDIIRDASDTRRKLFDGIMAQCDPTYLEVFQQYNRLLEQRNRLLKQFAERNSYDASMLATYSEKLSPLGISIAEMRKSFIYQFEQKVQMHYQEISKGSEKVKVTYETEVDAAYGQKLQERIEKDRQAQRTTMGIHKDDFLFEFDGVLFKKYASQGQKKSLIMALKMAQFDVLNELKGVKPILLLDDIFDKLDDERINMLMKKIENGDFAQVFISDARPERTKGFTKGLKCDVQYYEIE